MSETPSTRDKDPFTIGPETTLKLAIVVLAISLLPALLSGMGVDFSLPIPEYDPHLLTNMRQSDLYKLTSTVSSTTFIQTIIAWSTFLLASLVAALAIMHFYVSRDAATPVIGMAFMCVAIMELVYAIYTALVISNSVEIETMMPLLWTGGRLFHALIMLIGVSLFSFSKKSVWEGSLFRVIVIYLLFLGATCATVQAITQVGHVPGMLRADDVIKRPFDLAPLVLYIIAGLVVYPVFHRRMNNTFSLALLLSVIPDIVSQVHMTFGSASIFDSHYVMASIIKFLAYKILFLGIVADYALAHLVTRRNLAQLETEIEERQRAEDERRSSEARLKNFLDHANDLIMVLNPDGSFRFMNRTGFDCLGLSPETDVSKLKFENYVASDSLLPTMGYLEDVLKGKDPGNVTIVLEGIGERSRITVDGGATLVTQPDGSKSIHLSLRDITERQEAIENLRTTQGELDRFFALSIDMLGIVDFDLNCKRLSPAWSEGLGYDLDYLYAVPLYERIKAEDRDHVRQQVEYLKTGASRTSFECHMITASGKLKWFSLAAVAYPEKRLVYIAARDESDRKRFQEELIKAKIEADAANRAKSEFIANMSHEIRTPMNGVLNMNRMLAETDPDDLPWRVVAADDKRRARLTVMAEILGAVECEWIDPPALEAFGGRLRYGQGALAEPGFLAL
mgnify:CR=1 FL=1